MVKDITTLLEINDLALVVLKQDYIPQCVGSETRLALPKDGDMVVKAFFGEYKGSRPGLIKIRPLQKEILAADPDISRYVVISEEQVERVDRYTPETVFP